MAPSKRRVQARVRLTQSADKHAVAKKTAAQKAAAAKAAAARKAAAHKAAAAKKAAAARAAAAKKRAAAARSAAAHKAAAAKKASAARAAAAKKAAAAKRAAAAKAAAAKKKAPVLSQPKKSARGLNLARAAMWDRIAKCESGGNWSINTGNGYYGGLQFNAGTWRSAGGGDFAALPHQASRAEQITVANRLYAERGLQPWGCAHAA
ncbi:transglycosylase family protein [Nigerium massiliense]|uniref:transglycosylase family protein n=1 Tax=Nigerium massiliense TaxID=1522317 RepID=UPI0028FCA9ED|nr:transglycosylase family protein [Nigerium massiliense]